MHQAKKYFAFIFHINVKTLQRLVLTGQRQTRILSMIFIATKCESNIEFSESAFFCDVAYAIASLDMYAP